MGSPESQSPATDDIQGQAPQSIFRVRRDYNQWVADETLEDYALRFTAKDARRWSAARIGQTALGTTAFMALEALAAAATLQYGFINALAAMLALAAVIILTGIPIVVTAAREGLDIDLLTRGAGFGYLGSTLTSLIYATFTFIFFAIEAAILASAFNALFGIPVNIGYILCALLVIPIVSHGITAISRFQLGSQPIWLLLQISALAIVAFHELDNVDDWTHYAPSQLPEATSFNLSLFGACSALFFAMVAQIGEQVDYLRFMPTKRPSNRYQWWFWTLISGPGWILVGLPKMLLGSFLAYLAVSAGLGFETAIDPVYMYQTAFNYVTDSPTFALILAGVMVIVSQMKINVTNAYAGSIAWSNFFSRLTHSHPGRVVWLVFNVAIALLLMELGILQALEAIVGTFALIAISWLGCLAAELLINKPLGLSPARIEFKRSHLYDINPVGLVSMFTASLIGLLAYLGLFGDTARYLAHYLSLGICFLMMPLMAALTGGRFYLARKDSPVTIRPGDKAPFLRAHRLTCCICKNDFDAEDISRCPAYNGYICSLCCSLDARCLDSCKDRARLGDQLARFLHLFTPRHAAAIARSRALRFGAIFAAIALVTGGFLTLIYYQLASNHSDSQLSLVNQTLWTVFYIVLVIAGVIAWLFLLAHESRVVAQQESTRQTQLLMGEIDAHRETDLALQQAKEAAERANAAKSRYLSGITHELRTPLQAILGYAQLLQNRDDVQPGQSRALTIIRNSGEHLVDLIEGLLEISKIEAGRLDIYRNTVNIGELLHQLVEFFSDQAHGKGLEFTFHQHTPLPDYVAADERRVRQILTNLLSNAVKYTVSGKVDFHVRYRFQVAEFIVEDTGIGIAKEDIERILRPFERVRTADAPAVAGTGLGLTIVKLLTDVLGGNLQITSEPGQGSRFQVSLMLSSIHQPPAVDTQSRSIIGYHGKRREVLVVDDEPVHRGLVTEILTPLGFIVIEAKDPQECLQWMTKSVPDLCLLDVNMPGMSGLDLASQLRHQGYSSPILMLSANATETHVGEARSVEHNGYMTKPFRNQAFIAKIGELLKLTWVYTPTRPQKVEPTQNQQELISPSSKTTSTPASLGLPTQKGNNTLLTELKEKAAIGHKRGFLAVLDQIQATGNTGSLDVESLRDMAAAMRFDHIQEVLNDAPNQHG